MPHRAAGSRWGLLDVAGAQVVGRAAVVAFAVLIERMTANRFICFARSGRCSLTFTPGHGGGDLPDGTAVGVARLQIEGVHLRRAAGHPQEDARALRAGSVAARASAPSQPETEQPATPSTANNSRRERDLIRDMRDAPYRLPAALSPLAPVLRGEGSGVRGFGLPPLTPEYRGEGGRCRTVNDCGRIPRC